MSKCTRNLRYLPKEVQNEVKKLLDSSSFTCQNPSLQSTMEKVSAFDNLAKILSILEIGYFGRLIAVFKSLGSKQIRFFTQIKLLIQLVGSLTGVST